MKVNNLINQAICLLHVPKVDSNKYKQTYTNKNYNNNKYRKIFLVYDHKLY